MRGIKATGGREKDREQAGGGGEGRTQMRTEMEKEKTVMDCSMRKKGQGAGQRGIMGQRAGQGDIARNNGTGSSTEIYRQKVKGRMEEREKKRKGTGSRAEMEKDRHGQKEEESDRTEAERWRKKKLVMGGRPEGQGKTGGRMGI